MLVQITNIQQQKIVSQLHRLILISSLLLYTFSHLAAQDNRFSRDIRFVNYLIDKTMFKEANLSLTTIDTENIAQARIDTLHFYKGLTALYLNDTLNAIKNFNEVSANCSCFYKALIANSYLQSTRHQYNMSEKMLKIARTSKDTVTCSIANLLLAGNSLLTNNNSLFLAYKKAIDTTNPIINVATINLNKAYQNKNNTKRKSIFLSGLLSTIVPGSGKLYAGKPAEALGAFIPIASLGLLAAESYNKAGIKSVSFISFASLFTIFYLGNIWGSMSAVKIRNASIEINYEKNISINMLIPVKNLLR